MVGPLGGCWRHVRQRLPPKLKTLMAGPWRVLAAGLAAATTEVKDVNGGPLRVANDVFYDVSSVEPSCLIALLY
jgi:hypothetical protein